MNRPVRNEFFYAKCGCFGPALGGHGPGFPNLINTNVDFQELQSYFEYAFDKRISAFVNVPVRWINPDATGNNSGLGDVDFGAKFAFIYTCDTVASVQLRSYAPSGNAGAGLGTNHWTVEPKLLLWQRLSERLFLEAEVGDWIPIGGSDFAGNIIDYGIGLSFIAFDTGRFRAGPVLEFMGWTCLEGGEATSGPNGATIVTTTGGETIVNAKIGVRIGFGEAQQPGLLSKTDLYVGYSRALTGDVWYRDMWRVEFRVRF
jgi:hypothetical protein